MTTINDDIDAIRGQVDRLTDRMRRMSLRVVAAFLILAVAGGFSFYKLDQVNTQIQATQSAQQETCVSRAKARVVVRQAITLALAPRPGEAPLSAVDLANLTKNRDQLLAQLPPIVCG